MQPGSENTRRSGSAPHRQLLTLCRCVPLAPLLALLQLFFGCKRAETTPAASVTIRIPAPAPKLLGTFLPAAGEWTHNTAVPSEHEVRVSSTTGTGAEWAMQQESIKNDPQGQWANAATASSCFSDCAGRDGNSAFQATGEPNVDHEGDDDSAWSPKEQDAGIEWLDLTYSTPVFADGLRIRESFNAGSIVKVELYDEQDHPHPIWVGSDPTTGLNYLVLSFPKTAFKTNRVKVTLATNIVSGYNEIDAVQLVAAEN